MQYGVDGCADINHIAPDRGHPDRSDDDFRGLSDAVRYEVPGRLG